MLRRHQLSIASACSLNSTELHAAEKASLLSTANSFPGSLQIHGNSAHDALRVKVFNLILCESLLCCHPLSDNYCIMHRQ